MNTYQPIQILPNLIWTFFSVEPVLDNQEVDLDRVEQLLLRLQRSLTRGLMTPSAASSNDLMQPLMYTTARGRIPTSSMPAISRRASAPVLLDEDEIEEDGGVDVAGPNPVAINQSEASNPDNNVVDANLEDNGGGQLLSRRKRNRRCLHNCIKKKVLHPHQCHMLC